MFGIVFLATLTSQMKGCRAVARYAPSYEVKREWTSTERGCLQFPSNFVGNIVTSRLYHLVYRHPPRCRIAQISLCHSPPISSRILPLLLNYRTIEWCVYFIFLYQKKYLHYIAFLKFFSSNGALNLNSIIESCSSVTPQSDGVNKFLT